MPNRGVHVPVAVVTGFATAFIFAKDQNENNRILEGIGGCLGGYCGGRFPDVLEEADSPHHRAFVHSLVAGTTVSINAKKATDAWVASFREQADRLAAKRNNANLTDIDKFVIGLLEVLLRIGAGMGPGFVAGYVSHLALDACTQKSLPLA